jgi:hypothetical protein
MLNYVPCRTKQDIDSSTSKMEFPAAAGAEHLKGWNTEAKYCCCCTGGKLEDAASGNSKPNNFVIFHMLIFYPYV